MEGSVAGSSDSEKKQDLKDVIAFLDSSLQCGMGRMFSTLHAHNPTSADKKGRQKLLQHRRANLCEELKKMLSDWSLNQLTMRGVCKKSCRLYDAMIYKFGKSNRRQKYWHLVRQIYTGLGRINKRPLVKSFEKFVQALEKSRYVYRPSKQTVCYLGSLLLERILRLDEIRISCTRTASISMGYVELKHLLTFNLMSIAIASDVWKEAGNHINALIHSYDALSPWLRSFDKRFPVSVAEVPLRSIQACQADTSMGHTRRAAKRKRDSAGKKSPEVSAILKVIDFSESEEEMEEQIDDDLFVVLKSRVKPSI